MSEEEGGVGCQLGGDMAGNGGGGIECGVDGPEERRRGGIAVGRGANCFLIGNFGFGLVLEPLGRPMGFPVRACLRGELVVEVDGVEGVEGEHDFGVEGTEGI